MRIAAAIRYVLFWMKNPDNNITVTVVNHFISAPGTKDIN